MVRTEYGARHVQAYDYCDHTREVITEQEKISVDTINHTCWVQVPRQPYSYPQDPSMYGR